MTYFACTRPASDGTLSVTVDQNTCRDEARSPLGSVERNERPWSRGRPSIRLRTGTSSARRLSCRPPTVCATTSFRLASVCSAKSSANGGSGSSTNASSGWTKSHEAGAQPAFLRKSKRARSENGTSVSRHPANVSYRHDSARPPWRQTAKCRQLDGRAEADSRGRAECGEAGY